MVARKQVKSLESLPAAIHWLEKSMKFYEATMAVKFREEIRLPLLLNLLPDDKREDFQRKYTVDQRDFMKIRDDILRRATKHRVTYQRGPRDMEVDSVAKETLPGRYIPAEWIAYAKGREIQYGSERKESRADRRQERRWQGRRGRRQGRQGRRIW